MGRQRKNLQSKGMEDSLVKKLNEMEVSKLSDTEFKKHGNKEAQGTQQQLRGSEWEL